MLELLKYGEPIYETQNWVVIVPAKPHVDRNDGGHLRVTCKHPYENRTQLPPKMAIEMMRLTMLVGEAMTVALNKAGVDVGMVNYQENGNWSVIYGKRPHIHTHIYGRAVSAKHQEYGQSLRFPSPHTDFYNGFKPLTDQDVREIKQQIALLENTEKYNLDNWR